MRQEDLQTLLEDLQALPKECEWVEFKENNKNPQEVGEYLSALSNSACYHEENHGYLVFGIEDSTHTIKGTKFKPKQSKVGNQELENWLATQLNPKIDFNIYEFEQNGLPIAIFVVDATPNIPVAFKGTCFIRIGSYKKKLAEHPERERKIWTKPDTTPFEKKVAIENLDESEVIKLIDYPSFFDLREINLPENRKGIIEKLKQDRLIKPKGQKWDILNLGALLFAKDIEQFEHLSRKAVRVIIYNGNNRIGTKKEQTGAKGYAAGFEGLVQFINDQLPSNEQIGVAFREDVPMYPPLAIRELVANAIIHQDFNIPGTSPMVEIFDNRIEITNPGQPLIDPLRFVDHSPESRNEQLARFMRRIHICEERGSGIDKVVFNCEYYQLPAPDFIVGDNYTRATLFAPKTLRQMDKNDKIRACYLHACLKFVSGDLMTNQSLRNRFGVEEHNYATISRIIRETKQEGLIKDYDPSNKSRTYAKYIPFWA